MSNEEESEKSRKIAALTDEWLDLEQRREQLLNQKKAAIEAIKSQLAKVEERIHDLKNEITSIKTGESVPTEFETFKKQLEFFGYEEGKEGENGRTQAKGAGGNETREDESPRETSGEAGEGPADSAHGES